MVNPCLRAGIELTLALCLVFTVAGTGLAETITDPVQQPVFSHTQPTMEKLCTRMLAALAKKDRAGLQAITISEKEFKTVVWPQLPISKIKQWQNRKDFVWSQHDLKSMTCLNDLISGLGGRQFNLKAVKVNGEITDYQNYRVHRDVSLVVTDEKGETKEIKFFGSMVEQNRQYKIMSYNVH